MNTNRRLGLFFAFGIMCAVWLGWPELCRAASDDFLNGQLTSLDSKINGWEHKANVVGALVFLAVLIGVIVAALQAASNWWQMKVAIAVLSVTGAALGAYSHQFFPADDRAYNKAARQARALVTDFRLQLARFQTIDQATKDSLYDAFQKLLQRVEQIEESIYSAASTASPGTAAVSLIPSAYADTSATPGVPDWVSNVPSDEKNFYFVGQAKAKSFDQAKQDAIADAQRAATAGFKKLVDDSAALKAKPELVDQLLHALISSGEITQTFVLPDTAGGDFTGYALLRISKGPARFAAESVFVRKSEPYDKAFLQRVQPKDEK